MDSSTTTFGTFAVTPEQHQFKQSSTSLLAITFIIFIGYGVGKFLYNRKTVFGNDVRNFSKL